MLAALLLAPPQAAAHQGSSVTHSANTTHIHFDLGLSKTTITEGESVTVTYAHRETYCGLICQSNPSGAAVYRDKSVHNSAYLTIRKTGATPTATGAGAVNFGSNQRLSWRNYLNNRRDTNLLHNGTYANTAQGTVTISTVDDSVATGSRTVTVYGSAPYGRATDYFASYSRAPIVEPVTLTILDNDAGLQVSKSALSTGENGLADRFTVRLASAPTATVTVAVASSNTDEARVSPASIKFGATANTAANPPVYAWDAAQTVTVTGQFDNLNDDAQSYRVTLDPSSTDTRYNALQTVSLTGSNADNGRPSFLLQPGLLITSTISEDGGSTTVRAGLGFAAAPNDIRIVVAATPVSPATTADFRMSSNKTLTIRKGQTASTGTVTITAVNNSVDAPDKTVTLSGTAFGGSALSPGNRTLTITDDDATPGVRLSVASGTIKEASSTLSDRQTTVSATLTGGTTSSEATEVTIAAVPGAYTVETDATITIAAGSVTDSETVTITAVDDTRDEPGRETVTGRASNDHQIGALTGAALTITDDDAAPGVKLSALPGSITENGGTAQVSATLTGTTSSAPTTVTVAPRSGVFTVESDAEIVIAADATTNAETVTVTAVDNDIDAANLMTTVTGTLTNTHDGRTAAAATAANLTITDDDTAGLTVSETTVSTVEDGTTDTFTVQLGSEPTASVTVDIASSDTGEATVSPASITFGATADGNANPPVVAWDAAQMVTVTGQDDNQDDRAQTYSVTLDPSSTDANYSALQTVSLSGSNADDDTAGLAVSETTVSTGEDGTEDMFTVRLTTVPAASVTVAIASSDTDEARISPTSITFGATADAGANPPVVAWDAAQTVTVTGQDDDVDNGNQTYTVTVDPSSTDADYNGLSTVSLSGTNTDDDVAGLTLSEVEMPFERVNEGSGRRAAFKVELASEPTAAVTVTVTSDDAGECRVSKSGDAAPAASTTLTFSTTNWDTAQEVTLKGVPDDVDDGNQFCVITVDASSPGDNGDANYNSDTVVPSRTVSVRNRDLDTARLVAVGSYGVTREDGTSNSIMVRLGSKPLGAVTLAISSNDTSEAKVSPASIVFGAAADADASPPVVAWNVTQTVTVTGQDDDVDDGDQRYQIVFRQSSTDRKYRSTLSLNFRNADDDTAGLTLSEVASPRETVTEAGGTAAFKVALATEPTAAVTVTVTSSDDGECRVSKSSDAAPAVSTTLTFSATTWETAQEVTVTGQDDAVDDGDQDCVVTVDASSSDDGGDSNYNSDTTVPNRTVSVRNTDNDTAGLAVPSGTLSTEESGTTDTFTVRLASEPTASVTVAIASSDRDEAQVSPTSITFGATADADAEPPVVAWDAAQTVTVTGQDDEVDDGNQSYSITLDPSSTDTNYGALQTVSRTGSNLDDDNAGLTLSEVATPRETVTEAGSTAAFKVELGSEPTAAVTVTVTSSDDGECRVSKSGDAAPATSTTLTFSATTWETAQEVTVTGQDDAVDDGDQDCVVTVDASSSGDGGDSNYNSDTTVPNRTVSVRNTDNDDAPTVTLALTPTTIDESDQDAGTPDTSVSAVSASLSHASAEPITVSVAAAAGSNAASGDFALSANTALTIAAGDTASSGTAVTVSAVDNAKDEADKQVTVSGTVSGGVSGSASADPPSRTLTIRDDDDPPTVSIGSPSVTEGDSGEADLDFTVSLSAASGKRVTVKYAVDSTDAGTATSGADYTAVTETTLTFTAGQTSRTVTVKVKGDTLNEPNETVRLTLSEPGNATLGSASTGVGTITDDDGAPTVSISSPSVAEGDSGSAHLDFMVTLSAASGRQVTVKYAPATDAGTATSGTDYTAVPQTTLTFAVGETSKRVRVLVTGDTTDEPDETVRLTLSGPTNATLGSASTGVGTITDDDDPPTVSISSPSVAEGDSGEADLDFTVTLSAASGKQVTVKYADAGTGTATSGTDYTAVTETTLTFAVGDTSKTVTVKVKGDTLNEPNETVRLTLSEPGNATLGSASTGVGTITDDDGAPTVSISSPSVAEGDSGSAHLDFMVTLSAASGQQVTVKYAPDTTDAGTATSGADYTAVTETTLTFTAGQTSKRVRVLVTGDATDEPDETVRLTLSGPANATLGSASTGVGTITDDDDPPTVSIGSPSVTEGDSGEADLDFTVSLSAASGKPVTVKYAVDGTDAGTATSGTDYEAVTETTLTFAVGDTSKTVTVKVKGDTLNEPNETVRLTLSEPGNATLGSASTGVGTITDDDGAPTVSISSPSVAEGDTGSANLDFTVSLSAASGRQVTVKYAPATDAGTATAGTDYTAVPQTTLTFAAGETSKRARVLVTGDITDEPDETVRLTLSGPTNATLGSASTGVGTITDDDDPPTVSIGSPSVAEGDSGEADLDFTVSLSAASGKQVTVKYAVDGTDAGTATSGTDYAAVTETTLTFAVGDTSKTVTVKVKGDTLNEPNETVRLTLSEPGNATLGSASTGVGTITNDDGAPTVSISSPSVAEGDSGQAHLDFMVTLSAASGRQVTVKYAPDTTDAGTATSGADYTAVTETTLTFTAGQTSKRVRVLVTGDATDEPDETVRLTLSGPANATLGSASTGVGTITDDDDPPTVSIGSPSVTEGDSGEADLDFTVSLSAASGKRVTVKYAVDGTDAGTATSGTDYTAVTETTLTFAGGDTSKTVTVKVKGDTLNEPNETVRLTLNSPTNATLSSASTGVGTITDDDGAPTVSISSPSVAEGNSGQAHLDFMVTLSAASGRQVTVKYAPATNAGTATAGTDYTAVSQTTLTFAAGETSKRARVLVTGDAMDEPDETVRLTLSGPTNATLGSASTGVGTITDDDDPPTVSIGSASVAEGDSGEADLDFTVSLSAASGKQVTVKYAVDGTDAGTATSGTDYTAVTETTLTFAVGDTSKTVTVKVKGDTLNEPNETVRLTLSEPANATLGPASTGMGTITDDDGAPTVSISSPSVAEGDTGSAHLDFMVTLSAASGQQVTVKYAPDTTDAGTATAGTDYEAVTETTLTFAAGQTSKRARVLVTGDATDEPNETVRLTLSGPSNATLGSASTGVGTITDDDDPPTVSIGSASVVEGDSGEADLDFTVSLSAASGKRVTVKYAVDGTDAGTAASGTDYTAVTETTLTFTAGQTSRTVTVKVKGDTLSEPNETVRLTLSAPANATLDPAKTTGVGTILNDDLVPQGSPVDQPPSVNAGSDIAADEGVAVVLDGSASSDPENGALAFRWTQVGAWLASAAPADLSREADRAVAEIPARFRMALSGADTAEPRFTPRPRPELLENLVLVFRLVVTDSGGLSNPAVSPDPGLDSARDPGLVTVTVRPGPDDPPTAVARAAEADGGRGADAGGSPSKALTVDEGARVLLSGADSRDPEGAALSYAWTQTGPRGAGGALLEAAAVTLSDAAAESPTFVAPTQLAADLALEFTLAVNERGDRDAPATDAVTVTVRAGPNDAPTAVARAVGADGELVATLEVGEGAAVTLNGSGSSDPEGEALRYAWTQKSGPAAADLAGTDTARPTFTAPRSARDAAVVFGLVVTDARGLRSAEDTVSVLVRAYTGARLERVTQVLLPQAMRTLGSMQAAAVQRRLERAGQADAAENPGLLGLLERHGLAAENETPEWKPLLPEALFTLSLGADGADGGDGLILWSSGDYRDLNGDRDGVSWSGEAASAHLGADHLLANGARAGLAMSWSAAEFDYADAGDGVGGDWKLRLAGVQPYLGWSAGEGLDLWASLGYSRGELEIRDRALAGGPERADADTRMAATGARARLYEAAGLRLSARGEALYSRFRIDGNGGLIAGQTADATRLRLALDGEGETALASGARLSPRFELGLRHDGGAGASGLGVELGGGLEYAADGLRLAAGARALVANADYDEWGVSLTGLYAPADGRGLSFRVLPSWGETESGAARLWERGAPNRDGEARTPEPKARLETELGYGLASPFGRGLLQLTAGSTLIEDDGMSCRLAGMVELAGASWGLELEARYPEAGTAEHRAMVRGDLRF